MERSEDVVMPETIGRYTLSVFKMHGVSGVDAIHVAYSPNQRHAIVSLGLDAEAVMTPEAIMAETVGIEEFYEDELSIHFVLYPRDAEIFARDSAEVGKYLAHA